MLTLTLNTFIVWMNDDNRHNKQVIVMATNRDHAMCLAESKNPGFYSVDAEQTQPQSTNPNA
jgi:hypothetical protein